MNRPDLGAAAIILMNVATLVLAGEQSPTAALSGLAAMVGRISAIPVAENAIFAAFGHVSKCYWRKALAHALVPQIIMDGVDIGDLQADAAPAEYLTDWAMVAA